MYILENKFEGVKKKLGEALIATSKYFSFFTPQVSETCGVFYVYQ